MTQFSVATQVDAIREVRERASNALTLFRPTDPQEAFLRAMLNDDIREAAVTGGNRSGKSTIMAAWFTSVALNVPITLKSGEKLQMRPARWGNEQLLMWLVGYDWKHIGETLYRFLFMAGAFRIIKDGSKFVAYDPTNPDHLKRKSESKPSPPFIPPSTYNREDMSWESKKDRQLHSVTLKNGTRLVFYASTGEVAAGNPVHVIWIDEKILSDSHYPEWQMRVVDFEGRIVWSSWPTTNPSGSFSELLSRAEEEPRDGIKRAITYRFDGKDNPHTNNATREYMLNTMDDEEADARGAGHSARDRWILYDRFSKHVHAAYRPNTEMDKLRGVDVSDGDDYLASVLRANNGQPPPEWTRYIFLDPGHAHCGVLKVAIPPPTFGTIAGIDGDQSCFVVPYMEYDFRKMSADEVAKALAADSNGEVFEDITCDAHAYTQTPMGMAGTTVGLLYEAAFAAHGLRSNRRGTSFSMGGDDTEVRARMLQGWMSISSIRVRQPEVEEKWIEMSRLRIVTDRCRLLCQQLENCRREKDGNGQPLNKAAKKQKAIDLCVALEYAAIKRDLTYVPHYNANPTSPNLRSVVAGFCKRYGVTGAPPKEEAIFLGAGTPSFN